jgi:competence protein ComGF
MTLFYPANGCLSLLVRWLGSRVTPEAMKPCFNLLEHQVKSATKYEYPLLISMLQLMTCLAEQHIVASHLPLETIQRWMELSNWVICSTRSREVLTHVAKLLRAIVKVKNVSLLIEVYRLNKITEKFLYFFFYNNQIVFRRLASDLDNCFTILRENSGKVHVCSETEENALILLSPLADLGKIKSHFSSCFDY